METNRTFTYHDISPNDLSATDLREELDRAYAEYGVETDMDEAPIAAYRITIIRADGAPEAERADALLIEDRLGIAWGSDATWGDARGDVEAAINDWLNDADAWEARN